MWEPPWIWNGGCDSTTRNWPAERTQPVLGWHVVKHGAAHVTSLDSQHGSQPCNSNGGSSNSRAASVRMQTKPHLNAAKPPCNDCSPCHSQPARPFLSPRGLLAAPSWCGNECSLIHSRGENLGEAKQNGASVVALIATELKKRHQLTTKCGGSSCSPSINCVSFCAWIHCHYITNERYSRQ